MRTSKINYNPALSVSENARRNNVTEAAIRYFIRTQSIDRRYDRKVAIVEDARRFLEAQPNATKAEIASGTKHSLTSIKKYWDSISGEAELTGFDSSKAKRRQLRQKNNYYATHPSVTQDLLKVEVFHKEVLEPFCGDGSMAKVITDNGYAVKASDIVDRGYGEIADFFTAKFPQGRYDIVTNPPYDDKLPLIIARCLNLCHRKVALLLPLNYLAGIKRMNSIYLKTPPKAVYVYGDRINIGKNGAFSKSLGNKINYAWVIWEKGYKGETVLRWMLNNNG